MQQQCNPPVALKLTTTRVQEPIITQNIPLLLLLESSYTSNPRSNNAIQINHQPNSQANSSTYKAQDLAGSTLNAVALNPNLQQ